VGVQVKAPPVVMAAPLGTVQEVTLRQVVVLGSALVVRVVTWLSWLVAVAGKDSRVSSSTAWLPMAASTGAWLVSWTVTVISSSSLAAGVKLALTRPLTFPTRRSSDLVGVQVKAPPVVMAAPLGTVQEVTLRQLV